MSKLYPFISLRQVLTPIERPEEPIIGEKYRQVGVRLWGQGAYERETIDGSETRYKVLNRVELDDIIVNKIWARNGSVSVVQDDTHGGYVSSEFPLFRPNKNKLSPKWIYYLTKTPSFWDQCAQKSHGTSGQNRIKPAKFLEIEVPLPSLEEQQRIIAHIEALAARIEEARALRQSALEEAEALFTAKSAQLFQDALEGKTKQLNQVATLERGKFSHRPRNDPRFFGGEHPWIQIGEIQSAGKYIDNFSETLNDEGLAISRKFPKGTLLISIAATIGAVGILNFDCCVPDSIVAITPKPGYESEFIYYYLLYLRSHLEDIAPQSAQKNINLRILSPLPFPDLKREEQCEIVSYLDDFYIGIEEAQKLQVQTQNELDALLPSVLDKAFNGEL